jgi:hypothetical protein
MSIPGTPWSCAGTVMGVGILLAVAIASCAEPPEVPRSHEALVLADVPFLRTPDLRFQNPSEYAFEPNCAPVPGGAPDALPG